MPGKRVQTPLDFRGHEWQRHLDAKPADPPLEHHIFPGANVGLAPSETALNDPMRTSDAEEWGRRRV